MLTDILVQFPVGTEGSLASIAPCAFQSACTDDHVNSEGLRALDQQVSLLQCSIQLASSLGKDSQQPVMQREWLRSCRKSPADGCSPASLQWQSTDNASQREIGVKKAKVPLFVEFSRFFYKGWRLLEPCSFGYSLIWRVEITYPCAADLCLRPLKEKPWGNRQNWT